MTLERSDVSPCSAVNLQVVPGQNDVSFCSGVTSKRNDVDWEKLDWFRKESNVEERA